MPTTPLTFTTGPSLLPDVGKLDYNGCTFSPLFQSNVHGDPIKDEGNRTVKYTKLTIEADGYVTLNASALDISPTMATMHRLLTAQGGTLTYSGRGFNISVNTGNPSSRDLAWGPVPELIEFQPLGGGLSAKVKWRVTVHVSAARAGQGFTAVWPKDIRNNVDRRTLNLLQFNFDTSVSYGEDGYSTLSVNGTLEIPLTRTPSQASRTLAYTADDMRPLIQDMVLRGIDLSRFRITHRSFPTARDKRTLTWSVTAEEKPYMDLPPNCTIARGSYDVKPARTGPGLVLWLCSLKATYTLRANTAKRQAWVLFLALMRLRMAQSERGNTVALDANGQEIQQQGGNPLGPLGFPEPRELTAIRALTPWLAAGVGGGAFVPRPTPQGQDLRKAILVDFSVSEGLYLDSKTTIFSATWRICTTFSHILKASGLWKKMAETGPTGANLWATSVQDISGATSWLSNRTDPVLSVIVDFGL